MLPTLDHLKNAPSSPHSPLARVLDLLFEHSSILTTTLEPQLHSTVLATISSYTHLIDVVLQLIVEWDVDTQAEFISGHPRIGESKNLSKLSADEQAVNPTSPQVLARLAYLNEAYEKVYPGLRYITFVNGRTRAEIAEEMEGVLHLSRSPELADPPVESFTSIDPASKEWRDELSRAIQDIGNIAKSRVGVLGVN